MKWLSLVLVAGLSGCTTAPNPKSCADNFCHDPALPFCDVDGSISGTPNTCVAVECTPNEFEACRGDEVLKCNSAGTDYDVVDCEFGCNEAAGGCNPCVPGSADCEAQIIPAHLPDVCNVLAIEPAFTVSSSRPLDTNDDASCTGGIIDQATGPDICILRHESIVLASSATLTVRGERAVALVADHDIEVNGILDVSADAQVNGPGGGLVKSGGVGVVPSGSGGAGFKTAGGDGGSAAGNGGANNGGAAAAMNPALLVELVGGTQSRPYTGTCFGNTCGQPGGAGGALAIISCRGTVAISGLIDAGGGGGDSGTDNFDTPAPAPGGAGGSGGYVVLQGMQVAVTGEIYANGGAGGAGHLSGRCELGGTGCGADATRSATESARGGQPFEGSGAGGNGGREGAPPTPGWMHTTTTFSPTSGGGGGSTGFIQTYTPSGIPPTLTPRGVSPAFETNLTAQTR